MKHIFSCLVFLLSVLCIEAQVPQALHYQGIARDAKGNPLSDRTISIRISLLPGTEAVQAEYQEVHSVQTNVFGLYTLKIGQGKSLAGAMNMVKWESGNRYIQVSIDPDGGQNYKDAGTTQLLSVPYALYSERAGSVKDSGERTGAVNSNASHVSGDLNFLTKFTALNVIGRSRLFDNGTSIGLGTSSPVSTASLHIRRTTNGQYLYLENPDTVGFGSFRLYNDVATNFATFTKYGSKVTGGYSGISTLYPYANTLGYGNNGPFLNAGTGNIGFAVTKAGVNKLKLHIDASTERLGLGGNAIPQAQLHINNTDAGNDTMKFTNQSTGHLAGDGTELRMQGLNTRLMNRENGFLILGTNNTDRLAINGSGQVGIGTVSPAAALDVNGQLRIQGGTPGTGKILSSDASGVGAWEWPSTFSWGLTGNSGTNPSTHFIGTTDNAALVFKVNGQHAGIVDSVREYTFFGVGSGNSGVGLSNTGFGFRAMQNEQYGQRNVAFGARCLGKLTSGNDNSAAGYAALDSLTDGLNNTAVGAYSLRSVITASNNTGIGYNALRNNKAGDNTAVGSLALMGNTTGGGNQAIGRGALYNNTVGANNIAVGVEALWSNRDGNSNIAIGRYALYDHKTGADCIALGDDALRYDTSGYHNMAIGMMSMQYNVIGSNNTAMGHASLRFNTTGNSNTALGLSALANNISGNSNTAVGENAFYSGGNFSNSTAIGAYANITASNQVRIGNANVSSIGGEVGWSTMSDARLKQNIRPIALGLPFIMDLRPVTYTYKTDRNNIEYSGFIAQEVEASAGKFNIVFSGVDAPKNEGDLYALRYAEFVVPLVKAVQELNAENQELRLQLKQMAERLSKLEQWVEKH